MTRSIKLEPDYDALFQRFAREAQQKAETILAEFPDTLNVLDDYRADIIRRDVLRAFQSVLAPLNICAQSATNRETMLALRDVIDHCSKQIITKADEYEAKVNAADEPDEDEPDEDAITTSDRCDFYQYGKLVFRVDGDDAEYTLRTVIAHGGSTANDATVYPSVEAAVKAYMDAERFWPDVYVISDHGNAHRMTIPA